MKSKTPLGLDVGSFSAKLSLATFGQHLVCDDLPVLLAK